MSQALVCKIVSRVADITNCCIENSYIITNMLISSLHNGCDYTCLCHALRPPISDFTSERAAARLHLGQVSCFS